MSSPGRKFTSPTRVYTTPTRMIHILGESPLPAYDQWRLPVGTGGGNYGDDSAHVEYGSHIAQWRTPVTDRPRSKEVFGFQCETILKKAKLMGQQAVMFDDLDAQVAAYFYTEMARVQHQLQQLQERSQRAYDCLIAAPMDDDVIEGDINEIQYDLKQIAHYNLRNINQVYRKDVHKCLRAEEKDLERQRHKLFNYVLASQKPSRIPVRRPSIAAPPSDLNQTMQSPSPKSGGTSPSPRKSPGARPASRRSRIPRPVPRASRPYSSNLRRPDGSHLPVFGVKDRRRPDYEANKVPLKTKYQRMAKWIKCTEAAAHALDEQSFMEEQPTERYEDGDSTSDIIDLHNMLMRSYTCSWDTSRHFI